MLTHLVASLTCIGMVAAAEPVTVIADLDTREAVDAFASHVTSAMVEPVTSPRRHGEGAMRLRFFGHPSLEREPQVRGDYRFAAFRYGDWSPYEALVVDVYGGTDGGPLIEFFAQSGSGEETREFALALPLVFEQWQMVTIPIADIAEAGVDVEAASSIGFRAPLGDLPRPSRIVVDHIRLVGGDRGTVRAAQKAEDASAVRRRPRHVAGSRSSALAPRLERMGRAVRRSVRAPVVATPEVLVVGGGLAGVAAAVTAARMGADVLLVERAGALGGMATTGLVPPAFRRELTRGIVEEFCARLDEAGGETENRNPEIMKHVLLEMVRESGARLMLYTLAVDAIARDGEIEGIIVESKSGAQAILADIVIDCSGDADIAAAAGAPFEIGRGRDQETQTHTLVFLLGNVDTRRLMPVRMDIPEYVKLAREAGEWKSRFAGGAAIGPVVVGEHGVVNVNSINIGGVSGLKVEDLTYSHVTAHREAVLLVDFYRKYVPGCENCYLLSTAQFIGVRESRRIIGEYQLTGEDCLAGAEFDDGIARGYYPIDIHAPDGSGDAAGARLGRPYEIPYRCLVPKEVENLLVAGRPISADHVAHGSLRVMGTTMPLGEAAGCAAALCLQRGETPRELSGKRVRRMLKRLGAEPDTTTNAPDNLALATHGVLAVGDSYFRSAGSAAENAIDGLISQDSSSRWLSDDTPLPHWLELRFPEETEFDRVRLHFYAHGHDAHNVQYVPIGFQVQVKRGERWVAVAKVENNTATDPELTFDAVTAETMRVLFTISCPSDDIVRLREIEVHNGPPARSRRGRR